MIADSGLRAAALVRAGFFVSADAAARRAAVDDARRAIADARAIGAEQVVLVVGAATGVPLKAGREMVHEAVRLIADDAAGAGVRLAIEPLHPMYAAERSCVNMLASANELCDRLDHPAVGVAVDPYHIWWEPGLGSQIARAGDAGRIFGVHLCDWRTPMRDPLNDRGLMGDGCIDLAGLVRAVEAAGFGGMYEVEVFSEEYWAMEPTAVVALIVERYGALMAAVARDRGGLDG